MAEKRDMVQIESLEKYFGEDKERVHVLKGVSLNIPEGSLYTFLGPQRLRQDHDLALCRRA